MMPTPRKPYRYRFPIVMHAKAPRSVMVRDSATPGLLIQDCSDQHDMGIEAYAITHLASGGLVRNGISEAEEARYLAGALGGLPINFIAQAPALCRQIAKLDDWTLRLFLLLVNVKKPSIKERLEYRVVLLEAADDFPAFIEKERARINAYR